VEIVAIALGWVFYFLLVAVGLASIVASTLYSWNRLRRRGMTGAPLAVVTTMVGLVAFLGGWLIFDVIWVSHRALRPLRR
jgi:4-hydroxybenzoate polyprenyltransferase